ncbi:aminoglycoside phosphotransferase family protein [Salipiger abyssi]|uniref:aminoglycoside phosphotransferase family protein n=1 Tax=Salipiger abyssi TaxID=1250539 RepID=UPI001A8FCA76|nr:aminoglycoside phosphotransferase family protein [Salipiger abyssi]MBN9888049.1 phosphotransferase [Salipiger abyssi]
MTDKDRAAEIWLDRWQLSDPQAVARTALAQVWKVRQQGGAPAALKLYHRGHPGNERDGFAWLAAAGPALSCGVIHADPDKGAALFGWLDGPPLGDLARAGRDEEAGEILARLAEASFRHSFPPDFRPIALPDYAAKLFALRIGADCAPSLRADMRRAIRLAETLFRDDQGLRPLHGDLHHDNVILTGAGPRAIDAKGVLGPRPYERANAFRNPRGMGDALRDPAIIRARAARWAAASGVSPAGMLHWAAAKCALSIAWRSSGLLTRDPEADLLARFLSLADAEPAASSF